MSMPHFPVAKEPWEECYICGECHPQSQMVKHYSKGFFVGPECADVRTQADNLEQVQRREERVRVTRQKVIS